VLVYLLAGSDLFERSVTLRALIPDATGLSKTSPVRLNGVQIGEVQAVELSRSNAPDKVVEIRMEIKQRYLSQIPQDSNVQISAETMIGDKYVDISKGTSAVLAQPDDVLPLTPRPEVIKGLDMQQFQVKLVAVDKLLEEIEQGRGSLGQLVKGDKLYNQVRDSIMRMQKSVHTAVSSQATLGRIVYSDVMYEELLKPIRRLEQQLSELLQTRTASGRFLNDPTAHDSLVRRIAGLRQSIDELRTKQSRAGRFLQDDELYERTNRTITGLIEMVDAFTYENSLMSSARLYESITGASLQMQSTISDFRADPKKYLRINLGLF
jgi:phospholipid/cholesterol/gamma-HCH transport system substrate-binding protein